MGNHGRSQAWIKEEDSSLPKDHENSGTNPQCPLIIMLETMLPHSGQPMRQRWRTTEIRAPMRNLLLVNNNKLRYQKPKIMTSKSRIKIATWNVRTGYQVGNLEVFISELLRYGISIAALTELRLTESGSM